MPKKLSYKTIKMNIEKMSGNYKLLTTEQDFESVMLKEDIVPKKVKLKILCGICGQGIIESTYLNFYSKNRTVCKVCKAKELKKKNNEKYNKIKEMFEKENYILLSTEYIEDKNLKYQCPNGHKNEMNYYSFKNGHRCPECQGRKKYTIAQVKKIFEKEGCKLLTTEYKNNKQKLQYLCSCGNESTTNLKDFMNGYISCRQCANEKISTKQRKDFKEIEKAFSDRDYILLSRKEDYVNEKTYLNYICSKGHKGKINWNSFQSGEGCSICGFENMANILRTPFENIKKGFEAKGYTLLAYECKNIKEKMPYICNKHKDKGVQYVNYSQIRANKHNCRYCFGESCQGENSYAWKGGITPPDLTARHSKEYYDWRKMVLKRDNYICQHCGNDTELQTHHILNFSDYISIRFDVDNGITLCKKCHDSKFKGSFHNIYGTRNNTMGQLQEYLGQGQIKKLFNKIEIESEE